MTSAIYDITIDAGGDFDIEFEYKDDTDTPIDLSTYNGTMTLKSSYTSDEEVDYSDYITLGGTNGTININVPASVTSQLSFSIGVYDFKIISSLGATYKLLRGKVFVNKEV